MAIREFESIGYRFFITLTLLIRLYWAPLFDLYELFPTTGLHVRNVYNAALLCSVQGRGVATDSRHPEGPPASPGFAATVTFAVTVEPLGRLTRFPLAAGTAGVSMWLPPTRDRRVTHQHLGSVACPIRSPQQTDQRPAACDADVPVTLSKPRVRGPN